MLQGSAHLQVNHGTMGRCVNPHVTYIERSFSDWGGGLIGVCHPPHLLHLQNEKVPRVLVHDNYLADDPNTRPFKTGLVNIEYLDGQHRAETVDMQLGKGESWWMDSVA